MRKIKPGRWDFVILLFLSSCLSGFAPQDEAWFAAKRRAMVEEQLKARDITDRRVLEIMGKVPRHFFVGSRERLEAYEDYPLTIGEGQTISQPYIVALMTQGLALKGNEKVLEVGTGSGYQAAVLSGLCRRVFTIEIHEALAEKAEAALKSLGYGNVTIRAGDGFFGWPEEAPFDGIIVTAAARRLPEPLFEQLNEGGRMIIPIGEREEVQTLTLIRKIHGKPKSRQVIPVLFVPMTGEILKKK